MLHPLPALVVTGALLWLASCSGKAGNSSASPAGASGGAPSEPGPQASSGAAGSAGGAGAAAVHRFERIVLHTEFHSEGIAAADFDQGGALDVVSGPYWYGGPQFSSRHELYASAPFDPRSYADNFFAFAHDMNADGFPDVVVVGFPGQDVRWYQNPQDKQAHWPVHVVFDGVDTESPVFTDITGDGKPELVCAHAGQLGWAAPDWTNPTAAWTFHALSPASGFQAFTHGLGAADVDGNGRIDLIEATAWWQQPASLTGDPQWIRHEQTFGPGGAQMFAFDIDGDGDNDVATTWAAHGYGLSWFEKQDSSTATSFAEHPIAPKDPLDQAGGPLIHEPHALAAADLDGDGLTDLVSGQRFWGHVPADPVFDQPAELYWFRLVRT